MKSKWWVEDPRRDGKLPVRTTGSRKQGYIRLFSNVTFSSWPVLRGLSGAPCLKAHGRSEQAVRSSISGYPLASLTPPLS